MIQVVAGKSALTYYMYYYNSAIQVKKQSLHIL